MAGGKTAAGVYHQRGIFIFQGSLRILFALTSMLHTGDVPYYEYGNSLLCIPEKSGVSMQRCILHILSLHAPNFSFLVET